MQVSPLPDIPLNDLKRIYAVFQPEILDAVQATLASDGGLSGKETAAFCQEFSAYIGAARCLASPMGPMRWKLPCGPCSPCRNWPGVR